MYKIIIRIYITKYFWLLNYFVDILNCGRYFLCYSRTKLLLVERVYRIYKQSKYINVFLFVILLHCSVLTFLSNVEAKELANPRTLFSYSLGKTFNISIHNLTLHRRRLLKLNNSRTSNLNSILSKSSTTISFRVIFLSELVFLKFREYVNTYIEFRPPPRFFI
jgi:hypothetical protein